ncbi:hypothetical protein Esti_000167 [Eimeria stiedai]
MTPTVGDTSASSRETGGSSSPGEAGQQRQAAGGAGAAENVGAKGSSTSSASVSSEKALKDEPARTPPEKEGAPKNVAPSSSSKGSGGAPPAGEEGKAAQKPSGAPAACGVCLDASDSHIDLQIDKETKLKATCMHTGGFQYLWKGVRTTHGVKGSGKFYFEVQVTPNPPSVIMRDTPANTQHICRELLLNPVEHPKSVSECEFIMMCGLPACGKTYWAERHCERHASKAYLLLGTNAVIDQMRVVGLKRQRNYAGRWDELMSTANEVFNSLVVRAGSGAVPRNVIIDQTNVFKRARCRKVEAFRAWGTRRCVVMVTDNRTLQFRTQKRENEEGKLVPIEAVQQMKAAFQLPTLDEGFSVIDYVELPEAASREEIKGINAEGRAFKRDNPQLNDRQPKPHIEIAANQGCQGGDEPHPAKRQKGPSSWQAGGGAPWGGAAQHPQAVGHEEWAGGPPQGPPAAARNGGPRGGAAWSGSNAGVSSGCGAGSSYGGYQGGGQQYGAGPQHPVYGQQQQQQQHYGSGHGRGAIFESSRGGSGCCAQHPHGEAGQQRWQQQQQQQWQQHWQQQLPQQQYGQHWQQQGHMSNANGPYSGYAQQGGRY